jgi:hypothetical protein
MQIGTVFILHLPMNWLILLPTKYLKVPLIFFFPNRKALKKHIYIKKQILIMIITVDQLKLIHYYYFMMGIFSLTNAILLGFTNIFSFIFLGFYILNSSISWYMAAVARKKMKDYIILNSLRFFINHSILTVITVAGTTFVWVSEIITDIFLLNALLMANYFVLFLAGLWYVLTRTDFVRSLFTVYDNYIFSRSKNFIIGIKEKHWNYYGRQIVSKEEIKKYRYGTIPEVDDNLLSAWNNKGKKQYILECLGRIELALARQALDLIRDKVSTLKSTSTNVEDENLLILNEKIMKDREEAIMEYEKEFYRKAGEGGLL